MALLCHVPSLWRGRPCTGLKELGVCGSAAEDARKECMPDGRIKGTKATAWVELSGGPATVYNRISYAVGAEKQIILSSDEVDVPTVKVDLDRGSGIKDHRREEINRGWIAMYRHDGS